MKSLPPDNELMAVAREVNSRAGGLRVDFAMAADPSDGKIIYYAIFQSGPRRCTLQLYGRPSVVDVEHIVKSLYSWAGKRNRGPVYSPELPDDTVE